MRLGIWQKSFVYASTAVVAASGIVWFILHDLVLEEPDDLTRLLLIMHGASAYVLLVVVGSLLPLHVKSGWRRRRNLGSGMSVAFAIVLLGITALMLYYGSEEARLPARWVHICVGVVTALLFPVHFLAGKLGGTS